MFLLQLITWKWPSEPIPMIASTHPFRGDFSPHPCDLKVRIDGSTGLRKVTFGESIRTRVSLPDSTVNLPSSSRTSVFVKYGLYTSLILLNQETIQIRCHNRILTNYENSRQTVIALIYAVIKLEIFTCRNNSIKIIVNIYLNVIHKYFTFEYA